MGGIFYQHLLDDQLIIGTIFPVYITINMTIIVIKISQLCLLSKVFYGCRCKPPFLYMHCYHRKGELLRYCSGLLIFATNYIQNFFRPISIKNQNRCVSTVGHALYTYLKDQQIFLPNTCTKRIELVPHKVQEQNFCRLRRRRLVFDMNFESK